MKKIFGVVVVIAIVILAVIFFGKDTAEGSLVSESNAIVVGDQKPGDDVVIHYVKLDKPGYAVVYHVDGQGNKVPVGTSSYLASGEHFNVVVSVTTPTEDSQTIVAELFEDDGDEVFDIATDSLAMESGEAVDASAEISVDASEEVNLEEEIISEGYSLEEDVTQEGDAEDMEDDDMNASDDQDDMDTDEDMMMEEDESMETSDDEMVSEDGEQVDDENMTQTDDESTETEMESGEETNLE